MNKKVDALQAALDAEAVEQIKEIRAYRIYQGKDAESFRKARLALGTVCAAVRLRATIANEESNRLIALRLNDRPQFLALEAHSDAGQ